jgi:hypothetical protein
MTFQNRLGYPQVHKQFLKHIEFKKICCNSVMTVATLHMAGIHQVSHEFLFLLITLWKDLQDLQISQLGIFLLEV